MRSSIATSRRLKKASKSPRGSQGRTRELHRDMLLSVNCSRPSSLGESRQRIKAHGKSWPRSLTRRRPGTRIKPMAPSPKRNKGKARHGSFDGAVIGRIKIDRIDLVDQHAVAMALLVDFLPLGVVAERLSTSRRRPLGWGRRPDRSASIPCRPSRPAGSRSRSARRHAS